MKLIICDKVVIRRIASGKMLKFWLHKVFPKVVKSE